MMQKWADYLISAVRYEELINQLCITHLKVHSDNTTGISGGSTWTKEEVINAIRKGKAFISIFKDPRGDWQKGKKVFLLENDGRAIITDERNEIKDLINNVQEL
jgi:hypothetical protein